MYTHVRVCVRTRGSGALLVISTVHEVPGVTLIVTIAIAVAAIAKFTSPKAHGDSLSMKHRV